LTLEIAKYKSV